MQCSDCRELMDACLDGELMPEEAAEVRNHIAQCRECAQAYESVTATSQLLKEGLVHYPAPDVLKARIRSALAQQHTYDSNESRPAASPNRWLRFAAAGVAIALASSAATFIALHQGVVSPSLAHEVLTSHIRSLMPGHLTDVASNDQHNVKPWFNGRVNLSPQVPRVDSAGFILVGGRLDYLDGRPVAAVVYSRRSHFINVYSWPDVGSDTRESMTAAQGYHLVHWRKDNIEFWAVSDLNARELAEFVTLFERGG
jgi:anti-sigma factor RsiW